MPRVISYTRFSSRKQAKGLSYVRQIEAARQWCRENGYILDESDEFNDFGISAYSGANSETGALAELQKRLANGEIERGTILIVEALDRLTRQSLSKAISLLMNLATSGLTIVTLSDGRVWDEKQMNDLGSFLMSVVTLYRGHQESAVKSDRLKRTFAKHRAIGSTQAFGSAPGWLFRESKESPWQVDEEKADVVRRVFELAAAGFGSKAIAKRANDDSWPVPLRLNKTEGRWHGQMPGQILRNRQVLGEHQHRIRTHEANGQHWQGIPVGEPVKDYYPRIISDELWNAARASIRTRSIPKRRDTHYYNVFSGMMFCGRCGAPIHRKHEKVGYSRAQLYCSDKIAGKTQCQTMSAKNADPTILQAIYEYQYAYLGGDRAQNKSAEIAALEFKIEEKMEECRRIADAIAKTGGKVHALLEKSVELTDEEDELRNELAELIESEAETATIFDEHFIQDALQYLYTADDEEATERRALLHVQLSRLVDTIWLFSYDSAVIKFKGSNALLWVPLPEKRLPSRANPQAKHHKPPKSKEEAPKFAWRASMTEYPVQLPTPRRPAPISRKAKDYLLAIEEEQLD